MGTHPNLRNFCYLIGSGLLIQASGTIYRIWLARRIGPEGLGVFQMTYPIYRLLSSIATLGLPLALTKWVAEYANTAESRPQIASLRRWAVQVVFWVSLFACVLLGFSAPWFSRYLFNNESQVKEALVIIAFAIPFSALSAIYRGYYQGFGVMAPTALSEVIEQLVEVSTTLVGLYFLTSLLPFSSYAYPIIGLTGGEIASFFTLICFLRSARGYSQVIHPGYALPRSEILHYSRPLLINQIIISASGAAEAAFIPNLLIRSGHTIVSATQSLGFLHGMAAPISFFPLILIFPLGTVLSPQISSGMAADSPEKLRAKIHRFYGVTVFISLTSFLAILTNATSLSLFFYRTPIPVPLIKLLVTGMPFAAFSVLNVCALAAIGETDQILRISLWSTGLKIALLFLIPHLGINGAALANTITQVFVALTSMFALRNFFTKLDA